MEHIAAFLLIVGCSSGLDECRELPAPATVYETVEACEADRPFALREVEGAAARVIGECIYVDPAAEYTDAVLTWDITPEGTLVAALEEDAPYLIARGSVSSAPRYE